MGGEFKTKGVNVMLGPVVGPLGRVVEGGRNWEGTCFLVSYQDLVVDLAWQASPWTRILAVRSSMIPLLEYRRRE